MAPPKAEPAPPNHALHRQLLNCPALLQARQVLVGFSGGLDSTVLLHLLAELRRQGLLSAQLGALHVHHGLHPQADAWLLHCRAQAEALEVAWHECRVKVQLRPGDSPEAAARDARYAAFADSMQPGTVLALAHHADDQVETVLLHLLRGSGPRGLAGMPQQRALGPGLLCRPLLPVTRSQLLAWAKGKALQWIEDPANLDPGFTRNQLRHEVLPQLQRVAPGLQHSIARTAALAAEADELLQVLAHDDLRAARTEHDNQLLLTPLLQLSPARLRNVLRHWTGSLLQRLQGSAITHAALQQSVATLVPARADATPVVAWGEGERRLELRRYRDRLYLIKPMPAVPACLDWDPAQPLALPGVLGTLHCEVNGQAPAAGSWPTLQVHFRSGGERLSRQGRPGQSLKHLLQDAGVPPWLRPCVPLVSCQGQLLAAGDLLHGDDWPPQVPEKTARFRWQRQHFHCGH